MYSLVIEARRDADEDPWPDATPEEYLNSTAMVLLVDNLPDPRDVFFVRFAVDTADQTVAFRSADHEQMTRLRHVLSEIPELRVVSATI